MGGACRLQGGWEGTQPVAGWAKGAGLGLRRGWGWGRWGALGGVGWVAGWQGGLSGGLG